MTSTLHSFKAWLALLAITVLAGCAHPIAVVPDQARLARSADAPAPMPLRVGYHIPAALADMEVTTPGGGGDNIRYFPYRDIDAGFEKMLSNVFSDIVKLPSIANPAETASSGAISWRWTTSRAWRCISSITRQAACSTLAAAKRPASTAWRRR